MGRLLVWAVSGTESVVISQASLVVTFEVEDSEDRQFRTGRFVSIGLVQTVWIELLKVKERTWCFRKEGFPFLAFFL